MSLRMQVSFYIHHILLHVNSETNSKSRGVWPKGMEKLILKNEPSFLTGNLFNVSDGQSLIIF
jgi:hypothetical protein